MRIPYVIILMSLLTIGLTAAAELSACDSYWPINPMSYYRCLRQHGGGAKLSLLTDQIWFSDCVQRGADAGKSEKDVTAACVPEAGLFEISDKTTNNSADETQAADASH